MMESIGILRQKLELLLRRHRALKKKLAAARALVASREEEQAALRLRLAKCEEQSLALQIGHALPDAESRAHARARLDAVIADIDKMLSSLP